MQSVKKIKDELYNQNGSDGLWWLGNAGFVIRLDDYFIFIDPDVTEWPETVGSQKKRLHEFPLPVEDVTQADLVLYSHDHSDHMDRGLINKLITLKSEIWAPQQAKQSLIEAGLPEERISVARVNKSFSRKNVSVEITRSRHASGGGSSGLDLEWYYLNVDDQDSCTCGYLVKTQYGNIYHPGDTYYLEELSKLPVDYLLLPINDTNLGVGFGAMLTNQLRPKVVIPCHYGMYNPPTLWRGGHPVEYLATLVARGYWTNLSETDIIILRPGGKVIFN